MSDGHVNAPIPGLGFAFVFSGCIGFFLLLRWSLNVYKLLPTVLMFSIGMQVSLVVIIPAFVMFMRWQRRKSEAETGQPQEVSLLSMIPSRWGVITFGILCTIWCIISMCVDELDIWKVASGFQLAAYAIPVLKVIATQNVAGLSAKKFMLDALVLLLRATAASYPGHRLPRQAGNEFIRTIDMWSLMLVFITLGAIFVLCFRTYQWQHDTFSIVHPVLACCILAVLLHADVGHIGHLPDIVWTAALYLDTISMLPQLQLIGRNSGVADAATGHHICLVFVSRFLGLLFWWLIKGHWYLGLSYTGCGILFAYYVQLLILSSFLPSYVRSIPGFLGGVPIVCRAG